MRPSLIPAFACSAAATLMAVIAAGCGAATHVSGRSLTIRFVDHVSNASCPAKAPQGAECFLLRSRSRAAGFGPVVTGPTLDVEAPPGTPACGHTRSFTQTLRFPQGILTAKVTGPTLCLGRIGLVRRRFAIVSGTRAFAAATGYGTATINIQAVGATETWRGTVAGPKLHASG